MLRRSVVASDDCVAFDCDGFGVRGCVPVMFWSWSLRRLILSDFRLHEVVN